MPNNTVEPIEFKVGDHVIVFQGVGDDLKLDDDSFICDVSAVEAIVHRK